MLVSSCSPLGTALTTLTGGGPNVNAQVGKEVTQQIVGNQTRTEIGRDQTVSKVSTEKVDEVTIQDTPPWVILLLILGWLLPSPGEMGRIILGWVGKDPTRKTRTELVPVFTTIRKPQGVGVN